MIGTKESRNEMQNFIVGGSNSYSAVELKRKEGPLNYDLKKDIHNYEVTS